MLKNVVNTISSVMLPSNKADQVEPEDSTFLDSIFPISLEIFSGVDSVLTLVEEEELLTVLAKGEILYCK